LVRYFNRVLNGLVALQAEIVQLPANECPLHIESNPKFYPYFKDALGAFDGTHIAAHVATNLSALYRNRKGQISQNVFAACTFDMHFSYVLAGWEGSAHDSRVLQDARIKGFHIPKGKYYLGDAGYGLNSYCLTPYRGVRYHLREHYHSRNKYVYITTSFC